jgi:large subunit ribosomal protein L13
MPGSRVVNACPWYRACAATSPEWLTRIRRTDRARSASGRAAPSGAAGISRDERGDVLKTLIALSISPKSRSVRPKLRVSIGTLYYRRGFESAGLASTPAVLYTFAPFVNDLKQLSIFMYTVFSKPAETRGDWYLVDAAGKTLGRLASEIAHRLKGKHKPNYAPHQDLGDHIVVINAGTVRVTGAKLTDKFYHQHTGYVGNLKSISLGKLLKEHPERAVEFAVKGMLPKGPLGRRMYKKLHVFGGKEHPHQAQQPKALDI